MSRAKQHVDGVLALIIALLVVGGAFIFASAAFGLLARGSSAMGSVVFNHLVLGVSLGLVFLVAASVTHVKNWRRVAPYFYLAAVCATLLVFVPHIGLEHGGGKRWIVLFHMSFQPSEVLKIATLVMCAAYFSAIRGKIDTLQWGVGGYAAILALPALILISQPDLGTLGVIVISSFSMFYVAGARIRDIAIVACVGLILLATLIALRPYARDRVVTFLHPERGGQQEGYQIKQSLIAIGSGQLFGRGFGQGVQKFTYLPEPMGDSIFAVAGEELGFVGAFSIIFLFATLTLRGFSIAARTADPFGKYLAVGISMYLGIEAFINIASMLSIAPLTGIPLTFISQGGSAMLASLLSAGILLSISRSKPARNP